MSDLATLALFAVGAYLIGSIPFAYLIVRVATGEDVSTHGSGNIGAMNVRRSTGSWGWFVLAMLADGFKGLIPTLAVKAFVAGPALTVGTMFTPWGRSLAAYGSGWWTHPTAWMPIAVVSGAVVGHNYSFWMAIVRRRFGRTGKGLATGGGAIFSYDWRYFVIVLSVALATIALTRYLMAGQVAAATVLPVTALLLRSPDWPFTAALGALVLAAHWKRFVGMLQGKEPKFYINDSGGPRG
jgi:glycerol-3-phosphate acyltransferase PlsY